jgi:hypothetical protein
MAWNVLSVITFARSLSKICHIGEKLKWGKHTLMYIYEGSLKRFRTFIFSWETVRAGGAVIGRV